ncbi:MAG: hypothetical protein M3P96_05990 [Actinomycetota bacterium]|nr:hypothetical protein [Actinomycetota bacterium]
MHLRHVLDAESVAAGEQDAAEVGPLHISPLLDGRHVLDGVAGGEDAPR